MGRRVRRPWGANVPRRRPAADASSLISHPRACAPGVDACAGAEPAQSRARLSTVRPCDARCGRQPFAAKSRRRHPPPGGGRGTFAAKGWRLRRARQVAAASALQDASPSNGRRILPPRGHARPPGAMRPASEIVRLPAGPIRSRLSGRRAVTPPVRSGPCAWSGRPPRAGRPPRRPATILRPRPRALRSPGRAA